MHAGEPAGAQPEAHRGTEWARRFLVAVIVGLSIAAIGNIAMEASYKPETRALMVSEGGELAVATGTDPTRFRGRYWIASTVHDVAFGGVVVVPDSSVIHSYRFEKLADVDIIVEDYDPDLTAEIVASLDGLSTVQGLGNIVGLFDFKPFRVVWIAEGTPVPVLRLWYLGEMMYFIDDRVLTTGLTP